MALYLDGRPVVDLWAGIADEAEGSVTVRQVLSHQAGLPHVEGTFTLEQVLSSSTVAAAAAPQVSGTDAILGVPSAWELGFAVKPFLEEAVGKGNFGHGGAGGSAAFADPDAGIGFAYVMNHMRMDQQDRRSEDLVTAVYAALG